MRQVKIIIPTLFFSESWKVWYLTNPMIWSLFATASSNRTLGSEQFPNQFPILYSSIADMLHDSKVVYIWN